MAAYKIIIFSVLANILFPFSPITESKAASDILPKDRVSLLDSSSNLHSKGILRFNIDEIKSLINNGDEIGQHYPGYDKQSLKRYSRGGLITDWMQFRLQNIIKKELGNAGYEANEGKKSSGDYNESKVWISILAKIKKITINSWGKDAQNSFEGTLIISWEINDYKSKNLFFEKETSGFAKHFNIAFISIIPEELIFSAFQNAASRLILSSDFVQFAAKYQISPFTTKSQTTPQNLETKPVEFLSLKDKKKGDLNFNEILKSIISIKTESGHGSGFLINPDGYAITNYHVVGKSNHVTAFLKGWKPISAEVIRTNPEKDLALIKLQGEEYEYLNLGDMSVTTLGMNIYAAGAPISIGLSHSISKGIIGGIRKLREHDLTLLQTDASINPGNSGGPLINEQGEAIGVIALKLSGLGVEGLGFAISIDDAKKYLNLREKPQP